MRIENPKDYFALEVRGQVEEQVDMVARLYEEYDKAVSDSEGPWSQHAQNRFESNKQSKAKVPTVSHKDIKKFNNVSLPIIKQVLSSS